MTGRILTMPEEYPSVISVNKDNVKSYLNAFGFSTDISNKVANAISQATKEGYLNFYLLNPTRCLLCGSSNVADLILDAFLPNNTKKGFIFPICTKDWAVAIEIRGEDSEIVRRIREETQFLSN